VAAIGFLTWNMAQSPAAWTWLLRTASTSGVQVALLQEAVAPPTAPSGVDLFPAPAAVEQWAITTPIDATGRRWASAVAVFDPQLHAEPIPVVPLQAARSGQLVISHPGQWRAIRIPNPSGRDLVMVSLYGLWNDIANYAVPSLHRAISDLTALLHRGDAVVVAGDLDVWREHGEWRAGYATVFDRLTAERLHFVGPTGNSPAADCACGAPDHCTHVPTFRRGQQRRWQTDFVFAARDVEVSCAVDANDGSRDVSDHAAVAGRIQW
jgi:hypothetical protein